MNRKQLLQRCCKIAGGSGTWDTDDLSQFFHRFRPNGDGLAEVYDGVEHGDAVVKRLKAVMKMDGTDRGMAVKCRKPKAIDGAKAAALAKKALSNIKQLADELGDDELAEMFTACGYKILSGKLSTYRENAITGERMSVMCEVVDDIMINTNAVAKVMFEAVYTLVYNFPLAYYIQWPIVAAEIRTNDPFKPFFDLWCHNVEWRFDKSNVVEVFTPKTA